MSEIRFKRLRSLTWALCFVSQFAFADQAVESFVFDSQGQPALLQDLLVKVQPGQVIFVGETHGFYPHHLNQIAVISQLRARGLKVSVAIEHIDYTLQEHLSDWVQGKVSENDFLSLIGWRPSKFATCKEAFDQKNFLDPFGELPFPCYREQLQGSDQTTEFSLAINLSRKITNKVFKEGFEALTEEEKKLLPPNYEKGRDSYFERFEAEVLGNSGGHSGVTEDMIDKMFWAQSLWDETMAWNIVEHQKQNPANVIVVLIGDFHVAWGGGLPNRYEVRSGKSPLIISQALYLGGDIKDVMAEILPDAKYGVRADIIVADFYNEPVEPKVKSTFKAMSSLQKFDFFFPQILQELKQ